MADLFPPEYAALGINACVPDIVPMHRGIAAMSIAGSPVGEPHDQHDMKMTTLRIYVAALALAVLSLSTSGRAQSNRSSGAPGAGPIAIPMTADHWQTKENAEFLRQLGFFHGLMRLNSGNAALKTQRSATERSSSTSIRSDAAHRESRFGSRTMITSSSCILGPIPRVRPSGRASSMRPRRMAFCFGISFRNTKRGRRSERTGGITSRWSCPAGG